MPPQLQALMQNRNLMIGVVAGLLVLIVVLAVFAGKGGGNGGDKKITSEQFQLAEVDSMGKALEIQALLAREQIRMDLVSGDAGKVKLNFPKDTTLNQRDQAIITLVSSGQMDRNVGLESFDKGDLTASREEKRIKLIRAQQGELARLIRRIDPIKDASVSISIPESTLFRSQEKSPSATVQVELPTGVRLERDKVRAIINLMVGSIQDLDAAHVSLTDTQGNIYNSILGFGTDVQDHLEEQDNYMKQKIAAQLDKLVGSGNYVVSVSTLLREGTRETLVQEFDPDRSAIATEQAFNETLNASGTEVNPGGPQSSYIPGPLRDNIVSSTESNSRGYQRKGQEVHYDTTRKQWLETSVPGMVEDISIAITLDQNHYPAGMTVEEMQSLFAHAASPKADPANVTIATADFTSASPKPLPIPTAESGGSSMFGDLGWLPWAAGSLGAVLLVLLLMMMGRRNEGSEKLEETQREVQALKELAASSQARLEETQKQTRELIESQKQQAQLSQQAVQPQLTTRGNAPASRQEEVGALKKTLDDLKQTVTPGSLEEEDVPLNIRSWIESG
ncbi:MAG: flagellar M-ring protein FliF C-terminal domain-containing protein [Candidatus Melainabacteria bacterium]